jgi:hypothetical protein
MDQVAPTIRQVAEYLKSVENITRNDAAAWEGAPAAKVVARLRHIAVGE